MAELATLGPVVQSSLLALSTAQRAALVSTLKTEFGVIVTGAQIDAALSATPLPLARVAGAGPAEVAKTAAQHSLTNTALAAGQRGRETDTQKEKVGPGLWNDLPYTGGVGSWTDLAGKPAALVNTTEAFTTALLALLNGKMTATEVVQKLWAALGSPAFTSQLTMSSTGVGTASPVVNVGASTPAQIAAGTEGFIGVSTLVADRELRETPPVAGVFTIDMTLGAGQQGLLAAATAIACTNVPANVTTKKQDARGRVLLRTEATPYPVTLRAAQTGFAEAVWAPGCAAFTPAANSQTDLFWWFQPTGGTGGVPRFVFWTPTASAGGGLTLGQITGKQYFGVDASAIIPRTTSGCAALATAEMATNKNMVDYLAFDANADEFGQFRLRMPGKWNEGPLTAMVIWGHDTATTNFDVTWAIQAVAYGNGEALDAAFGTPVVVTDAGGTARAAYFSPESAAFTVAGSPGAGEVVQFQVYRDVDGNGTAGNDDLAVDAWLIGVLIFYTTDAVVET